jgi:NADH-quinone oxidoreductase subunit N
MIHYSFLFDDIYLFISFFFLLIINIFFYLNKEQNFPNIYKCSSIFVSIFLMNLFLITNKYNFVNMETYDIFKIDSDLLVRLFIYLCIFIFFIYSYEYIKKIKIHAFEYILIIYFILLNISLFISTIDLLSFYLLLEILSLSFYILTAFNKYNQYSVESGLKYFILSSFSSISLLYGFSFLYGISGTVNFYDINIFISIFKLQYDFKLIYIIGSILILIAFLFKLYVAPFHLWISDIYQGAPTITTAFFGTITTLPLFYVFIKLWHTIFYYINNLFIYIFIILSIISMIFGLFGALSQKKIKRLIAFSSVSNIGYLFVSFINDTIGSFTYSIIYLLLYIINLIGIFSIFLNLNLLKTNFFIERITLLTGFINRNKILSFCLIFLLFSSAGIPPFSLFFAKMLILVGLSYNLLSILILIVIFTTIFSSYYYLRIIKNMSFNINSIWLLISNITYYNSTIIIYTVIFMLVISFVISNQIMELGTYFSISLF